MTRIPEHEERLLSLMWTLSIHHRMWKLERLKSKEMRVWWDATMLKSYVEKSMIPRGLRINKKKKKDTYTAQYVETFMSDWNATLLECSAKLMKLIIQQEKITLTELKVEIQAAKDLLVPLTNTSEYEVLKEKMKSNLKKREDHILGIKKSKFKKGQFISGEKLQEDIQI